MRLLKNNIVLSVIDHAVISYATPMNISYWWNFGVLAGLCLVIQLITGIALAMHYAPHVDLAFASVEHIMRDVNYGWLLRYLHANGASMFFVVVYIHMFRGLYYGSYAEPRQLVWIVGVVIFLLMILTAFMGYVLPWGQMSFWAATVITNLCSAIPIVGADIVHWLWGGFSVDNATLNRFFSFHYLLPFVIAALAIIHLAVLHDFSGSNPLGIRSKIDNIPFFPYFHVKDLVGILVFFIIFAFFTFFNPNLLGHPDNYIPANSMVTPPHIVPEWYFLPFYAILRAIPNKLGGVAAMISSILILMALPYLNFSIIRSSAFRPIFRKFFWLFIADAMLLGWIGGKPPEEPYTSIGLFCTIFYFVYFIVIVPVISYIELLLLQPSNKTATK
jgi:ubiquinol-cytochrome c reductase cytochrome b subunit